MRKDKHPLYEAWRSMKRRCYQESHHNYPRYGARGIGVCDRWLDSFEAFVSDMGPKPTPNHTMDRINNDGNYEPGNVRWATKKENNRNKSVNRMLTAKGKTQTLSAWMDETGLPESTIFNRLGHGHSHAIALGFEPLPPRKLVNLLPDGWTTMAKKAGLSHQTVLRRVQIHGWTLEKALSTPVQSKPFTSAG